MMFRQPGGCGAGPPGSPSNELSSGQRRPASTGWTLITMSEQLIGKVPPPAAR
jgi:hypothetical protein